MVLKAGDRVTRANNYKVQGVVRALLGGGTLVLVIWDGPTAGQNFRHWERGSVLRVEQVRSVERTGDPGEAGEQIPAEGLTRVATYGMLLADEEDTKTKEQTMHTTTAQATAVEQEVAINQAMHAVTQKVDAIRHSREVLRETVSNAQAAGRVREIAELEVLVAALKAAAIVRQETFAVDPTTVYAR